MFKICKIVLCTLVAIKIIKITHILFYRAPSVESISKPFFFKNVLSKTIENDGKFTQLLSGTKL